MGPHKTMVSGGHGDIHPKIRGTDLPSFPHLFKHLILSSPPAPGQHSVFVEQNRQPTLLEQGQEAFNPTVLLAHGDPISSKPIKQSQ